MVQVKNRKAHNGNGHPEVSNDGGDDKKKKSSSKDPKSFAQKVIIGGFVLCMILIFILNVIKFLPMWTVNWPSSLPKLVSSDMMGDPELLWGTYRPHVYFGVKARVPRSPVFGIAWLDQYATSFPPHLRHWCSQDDKLKRYGWTMHDGREFGQQEIVDDTIGLNTTFVKFCHESEGFCDWSARISANPVKTSPNSPSLMSLLFYVAFDPMDLGATFNLQTDGPDKSELTSVTAFNVADLGSFKLSFQPSTVVAKSFATGGVNSFELTSDYVLSTLSPKPLNTRGAGHQRHFVVENIPPRDGAKPNLIIYQLTFDGPVTLDVNFFNESAASGDAVDRTKQSGKELTDVILKRSDNFRRRFETTFNFGAGKHKFTKAHEDTAMAAFSNLIGGIGYFYGYSLVAHPDAKEPVPYGPSALYTAVPSRSFFPRGFLWDEGFHTLALSYWDVDIVMQIVSHWLDSMNRDGWIPREQILDAEARQRVPREFIVQRSSNANPPAMFLTLRHLASLAANPKSEHRHRIQHFFQRAYPRLRLWVDWYLTTQAGNKPFTYRWRGRDADEVYQLNSKTLTSGLDDYPRASHPSNDETHIDLRCWIAFVSRCMADIGKLVGTDAKKYETLAEKLYNNNLLNEAHWFAELGRYADVGLHSSSVKLQRQNIEKRQPDGRVQITQEVRRVVKAPPVFGPVGDTEGYISLFPLLTRVLDPNSDQLGVLLKNLNDTSRMWTSFGLRSLSASSPYYRKRNTEHDPPYWRGQIWVNINYLVLSALQHYASLGNDCKHAAIASELYDKLRHNVVGNVLKQYGRTGYIWEQYDDADGHGMGSHPFTGWTSLFVLMMAEKF